MTLEADNVTIATTGAAYTCEAADRATIPMPTKYNDTLDDLWLDLGYLGPDGIEEDYNDDRKTFVAWQGGTIVRTTISQSEATFKFVMLESKRIVVELYHKGSQVVTVGGGSNGYQLDVMAPTSDRRAFVFDVIDGDTVERILIENGEVSDRASIKYVSDDLTADEVTITSYPVSGRVCRKFTNRATWAPAA
jgi:hypothetical protein